MDKLKLEHFAGYLPYGLRTEIKHVNHFNKITISELTPIVIVDWQRGNFALKPILRRMSDLTKEEWLSVFKSCFPKRALEVMETFNLDVYLKPRSGTVWLYDVDKGMSFIIPKDYFIAYSIGSKSMTFTRGYCFDNLNFFKELYKLHADIDGLIEKGLAIDINTLEIKI